MRLCHFDLYYRTRSAKVSKEAKFRYRCYFYGFPAEHFKNRGLLR